MTIGHNNIMLKSIKTMVDVVVGLQVGDEGKGHIVKYLVDTLGYTVTARFNGGPNAGHTVYLDNGQKVVLHQIPVGILSPYCKAIIGHGCVIDIDKLNEEIKMLKEMGFELKDRLFISNMAHVITKSHKEKELESGKSAKLGTTNCGIGPCYTDKVSRDGIRLHCMRTPFDAYICDTVSLIHDFIGNREKVLCEGAQGASLDLDVGHYPYVTSSNCTASAACVGLGLPPTVIGKIYGVMKAYTTRVGAGPFPTEMSEKQSELIREVGKEYGATTGRPRKIGWLDLPQIMQAIRINGVTDLVVTKLDVLSNLDPLFICTRYATIKNGKEGAILIKNAPLLADEYSDITPMYKQVRGWNENLQDAITAVSIRNFKEMLESELNTSITFMSFGTSKNDIFEQIYVR